MNKLGMIYKIIDMKNNKVIYIGQHKYSNINDKYMGSGSYLRKIYKKYGKEFFKREIIEHSISEQKVLDKLEEYWIKEFNTIYPNGYNITPTGTNNTSGLKLSDETKKLISEVKKANYKYRESHNKGKSMSEEQKHKISEKTTGINNPMYGKKHSDETKKIISEKKRQRDLLKKINGSMPKI